MDEATTTYVSRNFSLSKIPTIPTPIALVITSDYEVFATRVVTSAINRYYDPTTDQFLSIDRDVATTDQPYVFTNDDPLNATDPLGNISCGFCKKILNASETVNRMIVDVPQDASYLVYWGSYEAIRGTAKLENDCGSLKAACKTVGRIISAPVVVPEAAGLAGNGLAELAKGETIWQDDTPKQPLFGNQPGGKQLSDAFDDLFGTQIGRNMIFPGFNSRNRSIDFAWP